MSFIKNLVGITKNTGKGILSIGKSAVSFTGKGVKHIGEAAINAPLNLLKYEGKLVDEASKAGGKALKNLLGGAREGLGVGGMFLMGAVGVSALMILK